MGQNERKPKLKAAATDAEMIAAAITALGPSIDDSMTQDDAEKLFAEISRGVTNGDTHNHNGGDGAQISHINISSIGTNTHDQIDTYMAKSKAIVLQAMAESFEPLDTTIYSIGASGRSHTVFGTINKMYVPVTGVIKAARLSMISDSAGTNESFTAYLKINNSTNVTIQSLGISSGDREFVNNAMDTSINLNDFIEFRIVTPAWETNPWGSVFLGVILIEY
jgi:hypothetical protein